MVSITSKHEPLHLEETHNMLLSYKHRYKHRLEQQNATDETNLLQASVAFLQSQGNNYKKNQRTSQCKFQRRNLNQSLSQFNQKQFGRYGHGFYSNGNSGRGNNRGNFGNNFANFSGPNFSRNGSRPQCQVCNKYGHIVINCYHRFDHSFQPSVNNQLAAMIISHSSVGDDN